MSDNRRLLLIGAFIALSIGGLTLFEQGLGIKAPIATTANVMIGMGTTFMLGALWAFWQMVPAEPQAGEQAKPRTKTRYYIILGIFIVMIISACVFTVTMNSMASMQPSPDTHINSTPNITISSSPNDRITINILITPGTSDNGSPNP